MTKVRVTGEWALLRGKYGRRNGMGLSTNVYSKCSLSVAVCLCFAGRVGLHHLVLSSALMQRPVVIESNSLSSPATLYCNSSDAFAGIIELCGAAQLTIRNVRLEGCVSPQTFVSVNRGSIVFRNVTLSGPQTMLGTSVSASGSVEAGSVLMGSLVSATNATVSLTSVEASSLLIRTDPSASSSPGGLVSSADRCRASANFMMM